MKMTDIVAQRSDCLKRQVGAIIVKDNHILSTGYNAAPEGIKGCNERGFCNRQDSHQGENLCLCMSSHAEQNAIALAAKHGISCEGATIYINLFPCSSCMKSIINSGIKEIVYREKYNDQLSVQLGKESKLIIRRFLIGEKKKNNLGTDMEIIEYYTMNNISVYFPDYDFVVSNRQYIEFQRGSIICPYERTVLNKGYRGEGQYSHKTHPKAYNHWHLMLNRVYDEKYKIKHPTYQNCTICEEWHNFQNFAQWYEDNYYEVPNIIMDLDKDILIKGNKVYGPETCCFVPNNINKLFVKSNKARGQLPIGVHKNKRNKYIAQCQNPILNKKIGLGYYNTPEEAFLAYKEYKESLIKEIADMYIEYLPSNVYEAIYFYEVDEND